MPFPLKLCMIFKKIHQIGKRIKKGNIQNHRYYENSETLFNMENRKAKASRIVLQIWFVMVK